MTISASPSINEITTEFGIANNSVFPTAFYGLGGAPSSGALSFDDFIGRSNVAVYNPVSGSSPSVSGNAPQSITLTCNQTAVWTYTLVVNVGTGGQNVSIASGASATSITFSVNTATRQKGWNVSATAPGGNGTFTVDILTN